MTLIIAPLIAPTLSFLFVRNYVDYPWATLRPPPHHHLLLNAFVSLAQAGLLDAALEVHRSLRGGLRQMEDG